MDNIDFDIQIINWFNEGNKEELTRYKKYLYNYNELLHIGCEKHNNDMIYWLFDNLPIEHVYDESVFMTACNSNNIEIVKYLYKPFLNHLLPKAMKIAHRHKFDELCVWIYGKQPIDPIGKMLFSSHLFCTLPLCYYSSDEIVDIINEKKFGLLESLLSIYNYLSICNNDVLVAILCSNFKIFKLVVDYNKDFDILEPINHNIYYEDYCKDEDIKQFINNNYPNAVRREHVEDEEDNPHPQTTMTQIDTLNILLNSTETGNDSIIYDLLITKDLNEIIALSNDCNYFNYQMLFDSACKFNVKNVMKWCLRIKPELKVECHNVDSLDYLIPYCILNDKKSSTLEIHNATNYNALSMKNRGLFTFNPKFSYNDRMILKFIKEGKIIIDPIVINLDIRHELCNYGVFNQKELLAKKIRNDRIDLIKNFYTRDELMEKVELIIQQGNLQIIKLLNTRTIATKLLENGIVYKAPLIDDFPVILESGSLKYLYDINCIDKDYIIKVRDEAKQEKYHSILKWCDKVLCSYLHTIDDSEIECGICCENKVNKRTFCNHEFCDRCLFDWTRVNESCPTCRKQLYLFENN